MKTGKVETSPMKSIHDVHNSHGPKTRSQAQTQHGHDHYNYSQNQAQHGQAQTQHAQPKKSLTSQEALALINSLRGEAAKFGYRDGWIGHCIAVGDCAGKLAAAINQNRVNDKHAINQNRANDKPAINQGQTASESTTNQTTGKSLSASTKPLDPDHAKALGYIHDIGKSLGIVYDHPISGYRYFKNHDYADEYASVCLTHSFTNHECEMISGYRPADTFLQNYIKTHQNTPYEDLIALCDLYCLDQPLPLADRLIDVIIRYGASDRTPHRLEEIYKLKAKIEQQISKTVEEALGLPPAGLKSITIYRA